MIEKNRQMSFFGGKNGKRSSNLFNNRFLLIQFYAAVLPLGRA